MLKDLSQEDRLRLMKFVCSFAWADLEVQAQEKTFVRKMMRRLELDEADRKRVEEWLEVPPPPEEVDPQQVPAAHRELFLETIRGLIAADEVFDPNEKENLQLFEQLLR
ncbi:MAG: TerB family tellurite resistance protein [Polyangiaceae bacterium]